MSGSGNNINTLASIIRNAGKQHIKVQTAWAVVKEVDWSEKTMTATGVADDLDYYDVNLGLGFTAIRPKVGAKCLLGLIENNDAAAFLIDADEVEELAINVKDDATMNIDKSGFLIKNNGVSIYDLMNDLKNIITNLKVNTPSGPSTGLLPDSLTALNQFETNFKKVLKNAT